MRRYRPRPTPSCSQVLFSVKDSDSNVYLNLSSQICQQQHNRFIEVKPWCVLPHSNIQGVLLSRSVHMIQNYAWSAGHDTTASAICWTLYNLARHAHYQEQCRKEVTDLMQGRDEIEWSGNTHTHTHAKSTSAGHLMVIQKAINKCDCGCV